MNLKTKYFIIDSKLKKYETPQDCKAAKMKRYEIEWKENTEVSDQP